MKQEVSRWLQEITRGAPAARVRSVLVNVLAGICVLVRDIELRARLHAAACVAKDIVDNDNHAVDSRLMAENVALYEYLEAGAEDTCDELRAYARCLIAALNGNTWDLAGPLVTLSAELGGTPQDILGIAAVDFAPEDTTAGRTVYVNNWNAPQGGSLAARGGLGDWNDPFAWVETAAALGEPPKSLFAAVDRAVALARIECCPCDSLRTASSLVEAARMIGWADPDRVLVEKLCLEVGAHLFGAFAAHAGGDWNKDAASECMRVIEPALRQLAKYDEIDAVMRVRFASEVELVHVDVGAERGKAAA